MTSSRRYQSEILKLWSPSSLKYLSICRDKDRIESRIVNRFTTFDKRLLLTAQNPIRSDVLSLDISLSCPFPVLLSPVSFVALLLGTDERVEKQESVCNKINCLSLKSASHSTNHFLFSHFPLCSFLRSLSLLDGE